MGEEQNPNLSEDLSASYPGVFPSCRAGALGCFVDFAECLITPPIRCPCRHPFGFRFFCYHPNHKAIIDHTNKQSDPPRAP